MIERVILIKNIGKFHGCTAANINFEKLTLIFGPNGAGKTTFCDILRSLALGTSDHLLGRKRLSATDSPEVKFRLAQKNHEFKQGGWSSTYPDIQVFDKTYVHENVFAGDHVFHDQKKRLYHVILGETGTTLARRIEALAKEISELNRELSELKTTVEASVPTGMPLGEFLKLPAHDNLKGKIAEKRAEVERLAQSEAIHTRPKLSLVNLPSLSFDLEKLLAKTVESLSATAEALVREHVTRHLGDNGEGWLADGLKYLGQNDCPFCGRSLSGVEIIESFRAFFSEEYSRLKSELSTARTKIDSAFGETALLSLQKTLATNQSHNDFWFRFVQIGQTPFLDFSVDVQPILEAHRENLHVLLAKKKDSPLEVVPLSDAFRESFEMLQALERKVAEYNHGVNQLNSAIDGIKAEVSSGDLNRAKRDILSLEAMAIRHSPPALDNCAAYQDALDRKKKLEGEKDQAKKELDEYGATVCTEYQEAINGLLAKFGSSFRLDGTTHQYVGGSPSSTFQLQIDGVSVDVGDERTPLDKPSFRNTLSSGDRTTLAFAFFAVQLDRDPRLSEKVVVFDDPFTSQDEYRRTVTQHLVLRYADRAKQVIVLSHDLTFLRNLWDECPKKTVGLCCIQLRRERAGTGLHLFDIEQATQSDYYTMYRKLVHYRDENKGDAFDIAKTVRPFLECWIKLQCPGRNFGSMMLGQVLSEIENADPSSELGQFQADLQEMREINRYATQFHHADNPLTVKTHVDGTELLAFVTRAVSLL
jgi:wobble nucleotide-excising tRNase